MSFRSEVKFRLSQSERLSLRKILLDSGMVQLFPSRILSSLYFDNQQWLMFHESDDGVTPRKKLRIRSYSASETSLIETKVSSSEGRYKTSYPITIERVKQLTKTGIYMQSYGWCSPRIKVSYEREYFKFDDLRLTFDSKICYSQFGHQQSYKDSESVMEAKFDINGSYENILSVANLQPSRFSKYERAVKIAAKF